MIPKSGYRFLEKIMLKQIKRATMTRDPFTSLPVEEASGVSRRWFLQAAAAGGGLMLGLHLPPANREVQAAAGEAFAPNAFVSIGSGGQIVLTMPYVEMGQ